MKWRSIITVGFALLTFFFIQPAQAQLTIEKEIRLSRLEGFVYDRSGKPLADAAVSLIKNGTSASSVSTDKSGGFRIERMEGRYLLQVTSRQHAPAVRGVDDVPSIDRVFSKSTLYVILGPPACSDDCSSIVTSRRQFDEMIRSYAEPLHQ